MNRLGRSLTGIERNPKALQELTQTLERTLEMLSNDTFYARQMRRHTEQRLSEIAKYNLLELESHWGKSVELVLIEANDEFNLNQSMQQPQ